jgi:two-component system chemotaxis sensor kinase CheA
VNKELSQDETLVREFLVESEELLQGMDQDMVALESAPQDGELLNRVFRALHTIKGTSGFLAFDPVVQLTHKAEDVLNALRRGQVKLTRRMMDALLGARDQLGTMLADIRAGGLREYELDALLRELEAVQRAEDAKPKLGEILAQTGAVDPKAVEAALAVQSSPENKDGKRLGQILIEKGVVSAAQVGNALVQQRQPSIEPGVAQTMRVDARKLDELINLIGELVLERNRLVRLSRDVTAGRLPHDVLDSSLGQSTARLSFVTEELQAVGLKTRMVAIDTVFRKFPRLVRDIANGLQKELELEVHGQETELDKTMVELIGDPLVHLVRNSLDHGIERPEVREAAGKARKGKMRLEARQEGDQIMIIVADDGAGIDPARIAKKAVEKGLITAERARELTKREALDIIFLPGFSTAEKVNDISGRGVGMDVVRSNLKKLNGTVEIDSDIGVGTTVRLRLPLTLAILPVLLVRVAEELYALPLRAVVETARVRSEEVHRVEGHEVLRLRQETLPLVRLGVMFQEGAHSAGAGTADKVVILGVGQQRVALLVDELVGQESTVIKPLGAYLHHCPSVAGATISGDGRVRLVLDPAGLLSSARELESAGARAVPA